MTRESVKAIAGETGWRGTPDVWIDAAYVALIEGGVENVKVQILSNKLNLSRSSFYWNFKDRDELLEGLLARWRTKNTGSLVASTTSYAETLQEALLNVFDCWLDKSLFDSQFEHAVRSWALQSKAVDDEVARADNIRVAALDAMFQRFGREPELADVAARALYQGQMGYISMNAPDPIDERMARIPRYVQLFTLSPPTESELNRFYARHNYMRKKMG